MTFDLQRFLDAQEPVYEQVVEELAAGRKRTHWMWFIFPQVRGLGTSAMAERYAIQSLEEAVAYLEDAVLGGRLRECTALVNAAAGKEAVQILGYPDDLKFRSSMTLFAQAERAAGLDGPAIFDEALSLFFDGVPDSATLELI